MPKPQLPCTIKFPPDHIRPFMIEVVLPDQPTEQQKDHAAQIVAPLVPLQNDGDMIRLRPSGATVEEALLNLPREVTQSLARLQS